MYPSNVVNTSIAKLNKSSEEHSIVYSPKNSFNEQIDQIAEQIKEINGQKIESFF